MVTSASHNGIPILRTELDQSDRNFWKLLTTHTGCNTSCPHMFVIVQVFWIIVKSGLMAYALMALWPCGLRSW